jgi:hypothetical protein
MLVIFTVSFAKPMPEPVPAAGAGDPARSRSRGLTHDFRSFNLNMVETIRRPYPYDFNSTWTLQRQRSAEMKE